MKTVILALLLALVQGKRDFFLGRKEGGGLLPPNDYRKSKSVTELYFKQKLDHFNPRDATTWQQRYYINNEHFNKTSRDVAYIFIGGEGEISESWMTYGLWQDTAEETGALLFQLEHRFYGKSQPFDSLATENLRYLSSEQALADLAYFIQSMNKKHELSPDVKWIAFGGSYPGSLAAWMRQKYPHLVYASVSSSGPLLAKLDFMEYMQVVAEDMDKSIQGCTNATQQAFEEIELAIHEDNETSLAKIDEIVSTCIPLHQGLKILGDIYTFMETLASNFAGDAQYNGIAGSIQDACNYMTNQEKTPLENLGDYIKSKSAACIDYNYTESLIYYQNTDLYGTGGMRQWIYQTCTEFGFFQTSSAEPHVFGTKFNADYFVNLCADIFGDQFNTEYLGIVIEETNMNYGATKIDTDRILFVHGTFDPWHVLGKLESTVETSPVIVIEGSSHCADMYPINPFDPSDIDDIKVQIKEQVLTWCKTEK